MTTIVVGFVCILVLMAAMGLESLRQLELAHSERGTWHRRLSTMLWIALCTGVAVAVLVVVQNARLEARNRVQYRETLAAKEDLRRLSVRLVSVQEQERKALSRELHDQVGQALTAMKIDIARAEQCVDRSQTELLERLRRARLGAEETLKIIREMSMLLRPSMLDDIGLSAALNWYTRQFSENTGICVNLSDDGSGDHLAEAQRTSLYRIIQEALTNCARHSEARTVKIRLASEDSRYVLQIEDDGRGLPPTASANFRGLGLIGIQERVTEMEGELRLESAPSRGTLVLVSVPRQRNPEAA